ncbi:Sortase family protein [Thermomonospora echinospora]|uniref:Sortase family protein n=1 Tax=Thermomonospora echinospora TaxID=1992 RepID=A0A1H6CCA7_9ACTN|nr:sortase [Thermomonospora echinospora]SEG70538.1 Sortase family protein [Thermomonospora echinospora]
MITFCGIGITLLGILAITVVVRIPAVAARPPVPQAAASPSPSPVRELGPADGLPPSRPVTLEIPRLQVRTALLTLGRNADGSLEVPSAAHVQRAGWYRYGAAPGSPGPAVIAGYVDSAAGPAVFHRLGELVPGDHVTVLRRDRRVAVFRIDRVELVEQGGFPTRKVYGKVSYPGIRLVSIGGSSGRYPQRVIAYGRLVQST